MIKLKHTLTFLFAIILIAGFSLINANQNTNYELLKYSHNRNPIDSGEFFLGYKLCGTCHGYDSTHLANIDFLGNDVNVFDDWRSTMMANAARDPFFHAKVSHEITVNPAHAIELQKRCLDCHAPMGSYTALFHGATSYTLEDMFNDTLAMEGVSCMSCHIIGTDGLGSRFSGDIPYDTTKKIYGPFTLPFVGPMQLYVGMTPTYSPHMSNSGVCSPCHTLQTNSVDTFGNFTGSTFVEQATYHEWLNSSFPSQEIFCQTCHMPQLEEEIIIANQILALTGRSPFNLHQFAGANSFMLNILKDNKTYLGIDVPDSYFDSTILYSNNNLTQNTVLLSLVQDSINLDTAYFKVSLTNKAGHKFPSGYPSRRAVVQFVVIKSNGDTLFRSGIFGSNYEINFSSGAFQNHYNVINQQTQTQIYEMVMGDVNNNKTTILERAFTHLKDNRLPPSGFTTTHYTYDTVKIVGGALIDSDFNKTQFGIEGTGKDIIHFHVPTNNFDGIVNVYAKVYYQSVPSGFLQEMFSHSTELIDTFKSMYQAADKTPVLCASKELLNIQLPSIINNINNSNSISVFPSPTKSGLITIKGEGITSYEIYSSEGKLLNIGDVRNSNLVSGIKLPSENGIYYIKVVSLKGVTVLKVLRL